MRSTLINDILTKGVVFLIVVLSFLTANAKENMTNTFQKPDFAYPEKVIKNARKELVQAENRQDYLTISMALMQIAKAETEISSDSLQSILEKFEQIKETAPSPWSNLLALMQANLYSSRYMGSQWQYDGRQLPQGDKPENIAEWSKETFMSIIEELLLQALQQPEQLKKYYTDTIKNLLTNTEYIDIICPTLYEFIITKAIDIIDIYAERSNKNILPLEYISHQPTLQMRLDSLRAKLKSDLISDYLDNKNYKAASWVWINQSSNQQNGYEFLLDKFEFLKDKDASAAINILSRAYNYMGSASDEDRRNRVKQYYLIAKETLAQYKDSKNIGQLKEIIEELSERKVTLKYARQNVTGVPIEVVVSSNNLQTVYLQLYRINKPVKNGRISLTEILKNGKKSGRRNIKIRRHGAL